MSNSTALRALPATRPAHRPSRRHELIAGAVELFAVKPPESVTVQDLVQQVGLSSASFYYHFRSRDELLRVIVVDAARAWSRVAEKSWSDCETTSDIVDVIPQLLDWATENRQLATVLFVAARGAPSPVERARAAALARAATAASDAIIRAHPRLCSGTAAFQGASLLAILETALVAELSLEPATFRALGPRRFRREVMDLSRRIVGD